MAKIRMTIRIKRLTENVIIAALPNGLAFGSELFLSLIAEATNMTTNSMIIMTIHMIANIFIVDESIFNNRKKLS
jgi:hypothetical protein